MDQAVTYPANRNLQFPVTQRHSHRTTLTQNDTHSVNEFYSHVKKDFFGCKLTRTKNMATRVG